MTAPSTAPTRRPSTASTITGGAQQGFATNVNVISGGNRTPVGGAGAFVTQGGGVFLNTQADGMQISNNVIIGNSGTYAGAIRIGTPYTAVESGANTWSVPTTLKNTGVRILHNRMTDNGGTNLAGGVGIFDGSDGYVVDHNDLCGNFSAEYGGGLSHYGLSDGGKISFNRIYLNGSYDEGGGVMIAGELNPNVNEPSAGAAHSTSSLTIDGNTVERNLANDDGGGIRFLQAGRVPISVTNNFVNDNISTHEGGGFALDDSTNVSIIGNTVMRNITTATAATSDGKPAPAGLSTAANSDQLQATLPAGSSTNPTPLYSRPVLRSNLFAGNLAGTWNSATAKVTGISAADANYWDAGSIEPLQAKTGATTTIAYGLGWSTSYWQAGADPNTQLSPAPAAGDTATPAVVKAYDVSVVIETNRAFPSFRQAVMVAAVVAPDATGDYHLTAANGHGGPISQFPTVAVFPSTTGTRHDVDNQSRPVTTATNADAGADQVG